MAKPNYAFAKRQRELAKKQKKEEKLKRKTEPGDGAEGQASEDAPAGAPPAAAGELPAEAAPGDE